MEMPEFDPGEWKAIREYMARYSEWLEREGGNIPPGFSERLPHLLVPLLLDLIHVQHTARQMTYAMEVIALFTVSFAALLFYYTISPTVIALILAFGFLVIIFVGFTGIITRRL